MKKCIIILLSLFVFCDIFSQHTKRDFVWENYKYEIKQLDEFIMRFNLQEMMISPEEDSLWQYKNRILLFDKESYIAMQEKSDCMIRQIVNDSLSIHFSDSTWHATVSCLVRFKEKKDTLTLMLHTQEIKEKVYKWVISDAYGNILNLKSQYHSHYNRIPPTDNELNFISLSNITESNRDNILQYSDSTYTHSSLTTFYTLVYYGLLKIERVIELTYHFKISPDYEFDIKYFNRMEGNSGWLIYNIIAKKNQPFY